MRAGRCGIAIVLLACAACGTGERAGPEVQPAHAAPLSTDELTPGAAQRARARDLLEALHPGVQVDWDRPFAGPARVRFPEGWRGPAAGATPQETALALFDAAGAAWGMTAPREELRVSAVVREANGYTTVKLSQRHRGVLVYGTALQVGLGRAGEVRAVLGTFAAGLGVDPAPGHGRAAAAARALQAGRPGETVGSSALVVMPEVSEERVGGAGRLAWKMETRAGEQGGRSLFVDAGDLAMLGEVPLEYGLYREIWEPDGGTTVGRLLMNEAGAVGGYEPDAEALAAYHGVRMFDELLTQHGIASFTNENDWYRTVVHAPGAVDFGGGVFHPGASKAESYAAFAPAGVSSAEPGPALDLVAHEWGHGLLHWTGGLRGDLAEAAALHEAMADSIACMVDTNDWFIGDWVHVRRLDDPASISGGRNRYSQLFPAWSDRYENSTIFSHAIYLASDTTQPPNVHRDTQVSVQPIGRAKVTAILLRAIRLYLHTGTDFRAVRWSMATACEDLAETGGNGIVPGDCANLDDAFRAVEIPRYLAPTVRVLPLANALLNRCVDESGTGFPPNTQLTLVFEDVAAGFQARDQNVITDANGEFRWWFGLACPEPHAGYASSLAATLLDRVDPGRVGFSGREFRFWAEYADGGLRTSNVVPYALAYAGSCVPSCGANTCGPDGCGGVCGTCSGTSSCSAGTCVPAGAAATTVCGTIGGTAHWTLANSPVLVTCDSTVAGSLTIDPGVTVMFQSASVDLIVGSGATLTAVGTEAAPLVFTSDGETAASSWGGVSVPGGAASATIRHAEFRYGGANSSAAGYPIVVSPRVPHAIDHVRFIQNRVNAIGLVAGSYTSNLRLNVVGLPYWLRDVLTVGAGTTMTIDPGVVLKLEEYVSGGPWAADLVVNGRLVANGTPAQPIYFTSYRDDSVGGDANGDGATAPAATDWGGIRIAGDATQPASEISNAVIRYAGETANFATGYPIRLPPTAQPLITSVTLASNRVNAIGLVAGSYTSNLRLNVVGLPYWLRDVLTVGAGTTMTIDPGVVLKLEEYVSGGPWAADLVVNGRLVANGTPAQPIYFTSYRDDSVGGDANGDGATAPAATDWGGIRIAGDATQPASEISNAVIRYAGETANFATGYPIRLPPTAQPLITSVTLASNRVNAIGLVAGSYTSNLRLNVVGLPYWQRGALTVGAGTTMTIDPGVVLKLEEYVSGGPWAADLVVNGRLVANGTPAQPIYFTSYRDDSVGGDANGDGATAPAATDWGGIRFESGSTGSLSHAIVAYGGEDSNFAAGCALRVTGAAPTIEHVVFRANEDAVCVYTGGQPDLGGGASGSAGGNRFEGHTAGSGSWAVWNDSVLDVPARNNAWGAATAAGIDAIVRDRLDDATRGRVLYDGFEDCVVGQACSDGNACTTGDTCVSGHCQGTPYSCASPGACETAAGATCNGDGTCTYPAAVGATCDDGAACTHTDRCQANKTCAGNAYTCSAPGVCQTAAGATCNGAGGCSYPWASAGTACGDASATACTAPDTCDGSGTCHPNHAAVGTTCRAASGSCDVAETCDGAGSCPADSLAAASTVCRSAAGACDVAETCTGSSAACPSDALAPSTTVCRVSSGACDVAETCTGSSAACPSDALAPSTTVCRVSSGACDVAESCTGASAACPNDAFAPTATVCRTSGGPCDLAESCTGSSAACPSDALAPSTTVCRASAGGCDVAESCTGASAACPSDGFVSATTVCRASAGACDVAESCTGSSAACPTDAFVSAATVCRTSAGPCDLAESCTGGSAACPGDTFAPLTTVCRVSAGDCDLAETCTGSGAACPTDAFVSAATVCRTSGGPCNLAESCTGSSAACPGDAFASAATVCRTSAGPCDLAESCTGGSAACPGDTFAAPTTVCRGSAGDCDLTETCTGSGAACPTDAFVSGATVCRTSAGPCDLAESCTGGSAACPGDTFAAPTTVCRGSAGACDVAESCTGSSAVCPTDAFVSGATVCRTSAGPCDLAESCTGGSAACPGDTFAAPTTVCRGSAGDCDLTETCTGSGAACPTDAFVSAATVCRTSAGPCDLAESCTGGSAACPGDTFAAPTTVCRTVVGPCDVSESCTGTGAACPTDAFASVATMCRTAAGPCDVSESCTGTGPACPNDAFAPPSQTCRSASNDCDAEERCDGDSAPCPADTVASNGTACENVSVCVAGGACQGAVCFGGTPVLTLTPQDPAFAGTTREVEITVTHAAAGAPILLTGATIDPEGAFTIAMEPSWPTTVAASEFIHLTVRFTASSPGDYDATLNVHAASCADQPLALRGVLATVTAAAPEAARGGGGCSCGTAPAGWAGLLLVALLPRRRRRSR